MDPAVFIEQAFVLEEDIKANPRWFVVCDKDSDQDPEGRIWTVSHSANEPGWNTDSGFPGYGLTKKEADELAFGANLVAAYEKYATTPDGAKTVAIFKGLMS